MEPKKIKKLALNKETIANLNDQSMTRIRGGKGSDVGQDVFCTKNGSCTCPPKKSEEIPCDPLPASWYDCPTNILEGGNCHTQDYEFYSCNCG